MRRNIISIFIILSNIGCGSIKTRFQDPAFYDHIKSFEYYTQTSAASIDITFNNLSYPQAGVCYRTKDRFIYIDPVAFQQASFYSQRALIWHELAHCVLDINHYGNESGLMYLATYMRHTELSWTQMRNKFLKDLDSIFKRR